MKPFADFQGVVRVNGWTLPDGLGVRFVGTQDPVPDWYVGYPVIARLRIEAWVTELHGSRGYEPTLRLEPGYKVEAEDVGRSIIFDTTTGEGVFRVDAL